jgi:hypothetical protein
MVIRVQNKARGGASRPLATTPTVIRSARVASHMTGGWLAAVIVGALLADAALLAQPPPRAAAPRTPDGRPDLKGTWSFATLTPLERPAEFADKSFLDREEAAHWVRERLTRDADRRAPDASADLNISYNEFWLERAADLATVDGKYLTSRVVEPPNGRIPPLTPAARDRVAAQAAERGKHPTDGPEDRSLTERCFTPTPIISPAGEGNYLQIAQTRDHVVLHTEIGGVVRIVPLDGRPHLRVGRELVAFRLHLPSVIDCHNAGRATRSAATFSSGTGP